MLFAGKKVKLKETRICPLGDAASWPVAAAIRTLEMNLNIMFTFEK
jgi:NADH:ubiquinone oxidoreductase subunit F (NADH-binding)